MLPNDKTDDFRTAMLVYWTFVKEDFLRILPNDGKSPLFAGHHVFFNNHLQVSRLFRRMISYGLGVVLGGPKCMA